MTDDADEVTAARTAVRQAGAVADRVRKLCDTVATDLRSVQEGLDVAGPGGRALRSDTDGAAPVSDGALLARARLAVAHARVVRAELDIVGDQVTLVATRVRALRDGRWAGASGSACAGVPGPATRAPRSVDTRPARPPDPGDTCDAEPATLRARCAGDDAAVVRRRGPKPPPPGAWPPIPAPGWTPASGEPAAADPPAAHHAAGRPRGSRARATRQALLLAAAHRFAALGYHGTSLSDVLAEAGSDGAEPITKGALYFHFSSKHDLAQTLVDETIASWSELVDRLAADEHDPLWSVLATVDAAVAMAMYDPVTRAARRLRADHVSFADALAGAEQVEVERLSHVLERARDASVLRPGADPRRTADHLYTLFVGHRARSEDTSDHAPGSRADLWELMTTTWQTVLPSIATDDWLRAWRTSGWLRRPRPLADTYRLGRSTDRTPASRADGPTTDPR